MRFHYQSNGFSRKVVIRTRQMGSDWLALAVLLPPAPGEPEEVLRTCSSRTAVQVRSLSEQEAIDRMAFILENVYGCNRIA